MTTKQIMTRGWGNWDMYPGGVMVFQKDQEKEVYYELTTSFDSPNVIIKKITKETDEVYSPERREVIFNGMCHFVEHLDLLMMLLKITPYNKDIFPITLPEDFKAK